MKFKGTFILFLIAVAMGAYIYFIEIKKAEKDETAKQESERIIPIDKDSVKKIELHTNNGDFVIEKKDKKDWVVTSPVEDQGDNSLIDGMVQSLTTEKYDEVVSEGAGEGDSNLKIYGLETPRTSVTLTTNDDVKKKILLGIDGAIPGKMYLQREGEKRVLYASSNYKFHVDKNLKDLREKRVFRKNREDVEVIEVNYKKKDFPTSLKFAKKDGEWLIEQPVRENADKEGVRNLLDAVENLRAGDYLSEKGVQNPEAVITLLDKDKKVVSKLLISPVKGNNVNVAVEGVPTVYQVFSTSATPLFKKLDEFRDKTSAFEFKKDEVSEIQLKTGLADVHLVKKDSNWESPSIKDDKEVSQLQVSTLLEKLSTIKASEFLAGGQKDIKSPKGTVVLKDNKGGVLLSLNWGDKTKSLKSYVVKTNKSSGVLGVETSTIDTLPAQTLLQPKAKASESKP